MRVTPESECHATVQFSAMEASFGVLSSASDSGSSEMTSCQVSGQAAPLVVNNPCYSGVAQTWFGRSSTTLSAAPAFSGDGESGCRILAGELGCTALQAPNRTVLRFFLVDGRLVFGTSCRFRCTRWIFIRGSASGHSRCGSAAGESYAASLE